MPDLIRHLWFQRDEEGGHKIMQLHPKDMGGAFFEVDWDNEAEFDGHWHAAGGRGWMDAIDQSRVTALTGAAIVADDPDRLAAHWQAVAGLPQTGRTLAFENAQLRFIPRREGRAAGLREVDLNVNDKAAILGTAQSRGLPHSGAYVEICGVRFNLID